MNGVGTIKMQSIVLVGGVILVAVLVYAVIAVGLRRIGAVHEEQAALARELEELTRVNDVVLRAGRTIEAMRVEEEALAERIPPTMDFGGFYGQLTAFAEDTGVVLDRVQPNTLGEQAEYISLPVDIEAVGEFVAIYEFLFRLGQMSRLGKVARMNLDATDDPGLSRLSLTLHIYTAVAAET